MVITKLKRNPLAQVAAITLGAPVAASLATFGAASLGIFNTPCSGTGLECIGAGLGGFFTTIEFVAAPILLAGMVWNIVLGVKSIKATVWPFVLALMSVVLILVISWWLMALH